MNTFKLFSFLTIFMVLTSDSFAQKTTKETIPVSGNCGMCKNKIEKAAKGAGAAEAKWDADEKMLIVKYNSSTTNTAKIQDAVAAAGYDTRDVKTTDEAYNKLHSCCKYDRTGVVIDQQKMPARTTQSDGDCCKEGKCSMPGHDGKDCCRNSDTKMPARTNQSDGNCCKDDKCSKPAHDGKDCCKTSH